LTHHDKAVGMRWIAGSLAVLVSVGTGNAAPRADSVVRIPPAQAAKGKPVPVMEKRPQAAPATQEIERVPGEPLPERERQPAEEPGPSFEHKGLRG